MKKFSLSLRTASPFICCSFLLISGCSTVGGALNNTGIFGKPKVSKAQPANVVIERIDVAGENNQTRQQAESAYTNSSNSNSSNNTALNNSNNELPNGVIAWETLRVEGDQQVARDNEDTNSQASYTVNNSADIGIPTIPNEVNVESVDAPAIEAYEPLINTNTVYSNSDIWSRIRNGYAIPHIEHELIDRYIAWNQTHSDYVNTMLARSQPYLHYIVEQIEARGMPMEIALLPAIESAYKVRAYSRSRASGLWQFIPSTGRHFNMRQDWWSDQRRDVIIATNKALDYLLDLNDEFNGDWLLAMASYNGGRGTIARARLKNRRAGLNTDYFSLNLRRETAHYVPKILALSRVVMNPSVYGINLPNIPNEPFFETVDLKGQTDLVALIANTTITRKEFDKMNPQFLRWASDPLGPHRILVASDHSLSATNYINSLDASQKIRWRKHRLNNGDTLSGLARRYGVSASSIRSINGMRSNRLRAGKTILIPIRGDGSSEPIVQQATSSPAPQTQTNNSNVPNTHTVQSGDTLWNISRQYNISIDDLLTLNNLKYGSTLSLNQTLLLKGQ